jgi:hypothetical protein
MRIEIVRSTAQEVADDIAPAIGVHFTTSYAVAAARYQNGTIQDLARVAGSTEYIDLMKQWTNWEKDINRHDW